MSKKTITVGFAGLKGGCGKSTLAISFASYLAYVLDLKVVAVDADDYQKSLFYQRDRDIKALADPSQIKLQKKFVRQEKEIFEVHNSGSVQAPKLIQDLRNTEGYDVIIVDTGGKIDQAASLILYAEIDFIIIPFEAEAKSLDANSKFLALLKETVLRKANSRLQEVFIFWNKMRPNEKKEIFVQAYQALYQAGYKIFDNLMEYKKSYQEEEVSQSTILPLQGSTAQSNMAKLMVEITNTLNIKANKQKSVA